MKKVLIIGHFWPFRNGSVRIIRLAKYLPQFGWDPIIVTGPLFRKPNSEFKILEIEYASFFGRFSKLLNLKTKEDLPDRLSENMKNAHPFIKSILRFMLTSYKEVFAYPDEYKNWKNPAIERIKDFLKKEKVDALLSVWPPTSHLIAFDLKKEYKIPWLADFPDSWSQNHSYPYSFLRRFFEKRLEKKVISKADAISVVAPLDKEKQENLHKREIYLIFHGFEPEYFYSKKGQLTKDFTISYTGNIYWGKQNPKKFLLGLKSFLEENRVDKSKIKVVFYGRYNQRLQNEIFKLYLSDVVRQEGLVTREEVIKKQRESQVLLYLNWEEKKDKGVIASKLFEYLAAERPILSSGGFEGDLIEDFFKKTNAIVFAPSVEKIKEALQRFYSQYQKNGFVLFEGKKEEIEKYSAREMVKIFAEILNKISTQNEKRN